MPNAPPQSRLNLPAHWHRRVQAALVHVIGLAQYALAAARQAVSGHAPAERLEQETALLREEIRLKDARMARIPPGQRPHYQPSERLALLELRAARCWSLAGAARVFQLTPATIASWTHRLDEQGPDALLATGAPVNKFPDFVRYAVQRLQTLCPLLGKV